MLQQPERLGQQGSLFATLHRCRQCWPRIGLRVEVAPAVRTFGRWSLRTTFASWRWRSRAAYEQPSYGGRRSWRTAPRMFAWLRDDPEALVVWVEAVEDKEALIAVDPVKFITTAHYEGQPIVLKRSSRDRRRSTLAGS